MLDDEALTRSKDAYHPQPLERAKLVFYPKCAICGSDKTEPFYFEGTNGYLCRKRRDVRHRASHGDMLDR